MSHNSLSLFYVLGLLYSHSKFNLLFHFGQIDKMGVKIQLDCYYYYYCYFVTAKIDLDNIDSINVKLNFNEKR